MRRFLPLFVLSLAAYPATAAEYPARVIGVTDGDTLTVLRDGKTLVRIRLAGVDSPESGQELGACTAVVPLRLSLPTAKLSVLRKSHPNAWNTIMIWRLFDLRS